MALTVVAAGSVTNAPFSGTDVVLNSTGATMLIAITAGTSLVLNVGDNFGNAWLQLELHNTGPVQTQVWYTLNPVTGPNHTVNSFANAGAALSVVAFGGLTFSLPQIEGEVVTTGTRASSTFTPATDKELVISAFAYSPTPAQSATVDSPQILATQIAALPGQNVGAGIAYFQQGTAAPITTAVNIGASASIVFISVAFITAARHRTVGGWLPHGLSLS